MYLPPLRDRGEDIRLLAQHFLSRFSKEFKKPIKEISEAVYEKLASYSWPGNVRELRNVIERAVLLSKDESLTPRDIVLGRPGQDLGDGPYAGFILPPNGIDLRELEDDLIRQALARAGNNQSKAAKLLSLKRDAFRYRLDKLGLL